MFRHLAVILLLTIMLAGCGLPQQPASPTAPATPAATATSAPAPTQPPPTSVPPTSVPPTAPAPTEIPSGSPMPVDLLCAPGGPPDSAGFVVCGGGSYGFELQYPEPGSRLDQGTDPTTGTPYAQIWFEPETPGTTLGNKLFNLRVYSGLDEAACYEQLMSDYQGGTYPSEKVTVNGVEFTRATGVSGAAGTAYHWTRYSAVSPAGTCVNIEFALGIANEGNYATPPPTPDVALESAVFDEILATFRWLQ